MALIDQIPREYRDYFSRLTKKALSYKVVLQDPKDHWSPPWLVNGNESFLVLLKEQLRPTLKNKMVPSGRFYIYACGLDDTDYAIRDLTKEQALEIFNKIEDGCSQKDLETLGLIYGG